MRRPHSRLRRTTVLLLLALRTAQRTVAEEGGLRRPGGLRRGAVGPPPPNGRLPSEGGAGVRPASGADRGPRWRAYLHLEVRCDMIPLSGANSRFSRRDRVLSPAPPQRTLMSPPVFGGRATWPTTTSRSSRDNGIRACPLVGSTRGSIRTAGGKNARSLRTAGTSRSPR